MIMDKRNGSPNVESVASAISFQHLRYAIEAADHGSFRRAAELLFVRQSTLSRCIRQLEHSVGMTVFERSSGGVQATEAGRSFLRRARSILEQVDALLITAHRTGRGEAGRLAIGFCTSLSSGNLRGTLIEFRERFPEIALSVIETSRTRLVTALHNRAIDVAIVTGEAPLPDSKSFSLWSERILVALPQGHRLAANDTIYWTDLKGETLLLSQRDPGSEIHDLLTTRLVSPGDRPNIVRHDVSRESIKSLIGAGFGIGLTLEASLGANFMGVVHREVRDGTGPVRIGHSASWRVDNENPALSGFLDLLGRRYPSPSA
jgi:DNA-binding transcriptional LysR family regulator